VVAFQRTGITAGDRHRRRPLAFPRGEVCSPRDKQNRRTLEGPPRRRRGRLSYAGRRADRFLDRAEARVFRLFWLFLPEPAIARNLRFQHLLASRFLSDAGQQSLAFGALVSVTRSGASSFDVALVGVAALLPPAVLGLYGGAVADALPKRVALAGVYSLQAGLCFVVPAILGTELLDVLFLLLVVNSLGQVSGPTESAVLPLVASDEELASAASFINLSSAAGTAFGTALLAPVLVRAVGVEPVIYLAGALLLLAASRVFDLPLRGERKRSKVAYSLPHVSVRAAAQWLTAHPAVATMIVVAVVSGTANVMLQTLGPRYVQSVLEVDAADAAYVFAPSAIGLLPHSSGALIDENPRRAHGGARRLLLDRLCPLPAGHCRRCRRSC
jgi:hypothetical protein